MFAVASHDFFCQVRANGGVPEPEYKRAFREREIVSPRRLGTIVPRAQISRGDLPLVKRPVCTVRAPCIAAKW